MLFPLPDGAHYGNELARWNVERNIADDFDYAGTVADGLDQISYSNHDSILDENDVHYFADDLSFRLATPRQSGFQACHSRIRR